MDLDSIQLNLQGLRMWSEASGDEGVSRWENARAELEEKARSKIDHAREAFRAKTRRLRQEIGDNNTTQYR